jgi:hypothetical protein
MTHADPSAPPHGAGRTPARAAAARRPQAPPHGRERGRHARAAGQPRAAGAASAGCGPTGGGPR